MVFPVPEVEVEVAPEMTRRVTGWRGAGGDYSAGAAGAAADGASVWCGAGGHRP
jgi:hypothetical protein